MSGHQAQSDLLVGTRRKVKGGQRRILHEWEMELKMKFSGLQQEFLRGHISNGIQMTRIRRGVSYLPQRKSRITPHYFIKNKEIFESSTHKGNTISEEIFLDVAGNCQRERCDWKPYEEFFSDYTFLKTHTETQSVGNSYDVISMEKIS